MTTTIDELRGLYQSELQAASTMLVRFQETLTVLGASPYANKKTLKQLRVTVEQLETYRQFAKQELEKLESGQTTYIYGAH